MKIKLTFWLTSGHVLEFLADTGKYDKEEDNDTVEFVDLTGAAISINKACMAACKVQEI